VCHQAFYQYVAHSAATANLLALHVVHAAVCKGAAQYLVAAHLAVPLVVVLLVAAVALEIC